MVAGWCVECLICVGQKSSSSFFPKDVVSLSRGCRLEWVTVQPCFPLCSGALCLSLLNSYLVFAGSAIETDCIKAMEMGRQEKRGSRACVQQPHCLKTEPL